MTFRPKLRRLIPAIAYVAYEIVPFSLLSKITSTKIRKQTKSNFRSTEIEVNGSYSLHKFASTFFTLVMKPTCNFQYSAFPPPHFRRDLKKIVNTQPVTSAWPKLSLNNWYYVGKYYQRNNFRHKTGRVCSAMMFKFTSNILSWIELNAGVVPYWQFWTNMCMPCRSYKQQKLKNSSISHVSSFSRDVSLHSH